ncbi:hypothetical protein [Pantoea dispersa]|uniref:hypothetical protein n=1 Tax=Pantoea dispersa TaxID=59814 RepID=UPI0007363258|nr:hypothetical protein [Pantoea dispersa]KTR98718.1 hypothetical protein NS375_13725 [Pantoea dispersa]
MKRINFFTGIRRLTEQCEILEELAEMQEQREIILIYMQEALMLEDEMEGAFRTQTTSAQAGAHGLRTVRCFRLAYAAAARTF